MRPIHTKISMGPYGRSTPANENRVLCGGLGPAASLQRHHVLWSPSYLVGGSRRICGCLTAPGAVKQQHFESVPSARLLKRVLWENSESDVTTKSGRLPPMAARRRGILLSDCSKKCAYE